VLVQPYVGLKSDNCRIRWGKRRPFIVGGAIATIVSLMVLAWAKEIVSNFFAIFGADNESQFVKTSVMIFAVLFVYVLDFAINVSKYW
jgi:solute carrier family 45 protein 1/2/4